MFTGLQKKFLLRLVLHILLKDKKLFSKYDICIWI